MEEWLIVGLGNPGMKYSSTRHNIGWMVLDESPLSRTLSWQKKFKGLYASTTEAGKRLHFLKPETYMNLSGESVASCVKFFKIPIKNIIVIHDELDHPFGTLSLKEGGGLAGHNGLKSIAELLGTRDFLRIRAGIGRPPHGNVSSWVLSKFDSDEQIALDRFLNLISEGLETLIRQGFQKSASLFSRKSCL